MLRKEMNKTVPHNFTFIPSESFNENKVFFFIWNRDTFFLCFFSNFCGLISVNLWDVGINKIRPDKNLSTKNLHEKFSLLNIFIILVEVEAHIYNWQSEEGYLKFIILYLNSSDNPGDKVSIFWWMIVVRWVQ